MTQTPAEFLGRNLMFLDRQMLIEPSVNATAILRGAPSDDFIGVLPPKEFTVAGKAPNVHGEPFDSAVHPEPVEGERPAQDRPVEP